MKKRFSLKETKLFIALALLVQSFTFFIMFIVLCFKKKSIAAAFLAVGAMEGATGAYLLYQIKEEEAQEFDPEAALAADEALDIDVELDEAEIAADLSHGVNEQEDGVRRVAEIPCEEHVSEEEFQ